MSIGQRISTKSTPFETSNRFVATFNVPTPGEYDFGIAANRNQTVLALNPNYVYLIDRVSFSASIDEGVYLGAVNAQPTFRLRYRNSTLTYPAGLPAVNYKDDLEFNFWFWTTKTNDELLITLTGSLLQTPPLVGVPTVAAQISYVIYQENNLRVIESVKRGTFRDAGKFYEEV